MTGRSSNGALTGLTVIVTGGTSGIGRATCLALGEQAADVIVVGRHAGRLGEVARELRQMGTRPLPLALDVRRAEDMELMTQRALEHGGRVHALVACAGIARAPDSPLLPYAVTQMPLAEWTDVLDTNLRGVFLSNRAVLPSMIAAGDGVIVNIVSSPAAIKGQPFAAAYCASKFAVAGLTESLSAEVSPHGIRVFGVFPDLVDTPLVKNTTLVSRFGPGLAPERVADFVVGLLVMQGSTYVPAVRRLGYPVLSRMPQIERRTT